MLNPTDSDFDNVWLVGEEFSKVKSPFRKFENVEEVKTIISRENITHFTILIKGSNSTRLYELPDFL